MLSFQTLNKAFLKQMRMRMLKKMHIWNQIIHRYTDFF